MAIIQALIGLVLKSAGKILNAIFGWAVHALFGKMSAREQTKMSALVAAAAAWPLLVAGIIAPKVAAFALAFVPLPKSVPSWTVRLVWIGLALAVPITMGVALAAKRAPGVRSEPTFVRVLRGFPLTLGLALAFLVMFVSVPVMRLVALIRREKSADIPLVTDAHAYHEEARLIVEALNRHGFRMRAVEPGWWIKAPTRILAIFGGRAFSSFVPIDIESYASEDLQLSFYTSGALLRGKRERLAWAHGLIQETAARGAGLQTFTPDAQKLERRIHAIRKASEADSMRDAASLLGRIKGLGDELTRLQVDHDEWQVLYRELLQAERAVRGEPQLLDEGAPRESRKVAGTNRSKNGSVDRRP
jgi:hypothetical protein